MYCSNGTDSETRGVTLDVDACVFSKLVHWMDLKKHLDLTGLSMGATVVANGVSITFSEYICTLFYTRIQLMKL